MKRLLIALVPLLLVTACGQTEPDPTPVPTTPTVSVSSPSPSATSEDELYAEAERVFWAAVQIMNAREVTGEYAGLKDELAPYAMGDYLESTMAAYSLLEEKQWHGREDEAPEISVEPAPGLVFEDSEVALHACKDSTRAPLYGPDGSVASTGRIVESRYYFKHDTDGRLKVFSQEYREVESCVLGS